MPCEESAKDTAVYGGEIEQLVRVGSIDQRRGLGRQFLEDLVQGLGVKQPRGFAKGAQRRRPNPQSSLNGLQGRSLLQSAQAGNRGTKEVEQQELSGDTKTDPPGDTKTDPLLNTC